ncbi:tRNA-specific 2-thiouridylase mnmA [Desulfurobacterium thermolithotrophum DSM 11699]|uniref:tRNA-specific 2-thiouridylase MnmA n=2 Tax=Desulfurobacterium thermolithotrophum TaxID=64160 RepID=F0S0T0_DESTD|nr:tRNA-specific 2-thiouridylase mnmA [Desulfurobacterium thermolithotrophum DSM 11699]
MKKVILGFSGGIDSFYTAYLLKEQRFKVFPVYFKVLPDISTEKAEESASILGLGLTVIDLSDEFRKKVINHFIEYYKKGLTPNPCAICNKDIKLKYLYELSKELKADFISTGHYAKVSYFDKWKKNLILRGKDKRKEQSYFLSLVEKFVFQKLLLPLGNFTKEEVVLRAQELGFPFESESQDICFIEGHYVNFLEKFIKPKPGVFVLIDGTPVGKHKGYYKYTVGQRRGLGISYTKPLYVISIDAKRNRVIVGEKKEIQKDIIYVKNINWHLDYEVVKKFDTIQVQIRYRSKPVEVEKIDYLKNGIFCVKLAAKVDAPAPGQVCAFYSNELLLGGGEITTEGEGIWKEVL